MQIVKYQVGQEIDRKKFEEALADLRYRRSAHVSVPGEYAIRGGIFDVYPLTYRAPVRIEFEAERIASIRDFSPQEGKSLTYFDELYLIPLTPAVEKKIARLQERYTGFDPLTEVKDLEPGDYVVHLRYGIGRFLGSKRIQLQGESKRYLAIEYADQEILYLDPAEPIERYIGGEGYQPRLTKLHTKEWEKVKKRTRVAVNRVAQEMITLQAKRESKAGFAFPPDLPWQKEFEAEFPFEETPDQQRAIEEVKADMESPRPMDRLLCGDVGYGKTEVAMRAAFKAVTAGRQVAFLVPTTVLAEQHYLLLKSRLRNFPINVEVLSRFRSKKEQAGIVALLKTGTTDIVIGTHRLLSSDIRFKDLGLVIIDEEQRFGVRHKEKLKQLRELVDVLTLTATPIPRTLYMSLVGVRDMSLINTPPRNRLPIETYVMEYNETKIREGFERELSRGGQIYFVHNRVQSIEKIYTRLTDLLPHVRFGVAHGQMPAHVLETVMADFLEHKIDCLISTNIIESGIDIPNVNTIFVNRADTFGLSELYQLRGRVGRYRGVRQAYAYFLVPRNWVLTQDAEKRLAAIERFTELGSGIKIAMEDLQIRGAGNLLGHEQSGFIHAVGFDLYCRMLRQAIAEQKKAVPKQSETGEAASL